MNKRLQQLADIRNKIYQVTEKLAIEMDLHLEATKVDTQAIYALSKISDTYAKLVMTEEKLEQEIIKREVVRKEKLAEEGTPPKEISATDRVILGMFAEKRYRSDNIKSSKANYNFSREKSTEKNNCDSNQFLESTVEEEARYSSGSSENKTSLYPPSYVKTSCSGADSALVNR